MQKKLIAVAVASVVAAPLALAQSNVTIYGIADAAIARTSASGHSNFVVSSGNLNGSRLGFKGSENLGNGLKAVFDIEMGYSIDTGASGPGTLFGRQAWVGLSSQWGALSLGRQYNPGFFSSARYDAMLGTNFSPVEILAGAPGVGNDVKLGSTRLRAGGSARTNNSIVYDSPNYMGFKGRLIYGAGETANDFNRGRTVALGVDYANGPLAVGYVHSRYRLTTAEALDGQNDNDLKENLIGASYDFGIAKLVGSWQNAEDESAIIPGGNPSDKSTTWNIGVDVPVGAGVVAVSYARKDVTGNSNLEANSYTLAYVHNLSKRTALYGGVNHTSNDSLAKFGDFSGAGIAAGNDPTTWLIGMRHAF